MWLCRCLGRTAVLNLCNLAARLGKDEGNWATRVAGWHTRCECPLAHYLRMLSCTHTSQPLTRSNSKQTTARSSTPGVEYPFVLLPSLFLGNKLLYLDRRFWDLADKGQFLHTVALGAEVMQAGRTWLVLLPNLKVKRSGFTAS